MRQRRASALVVVGLGIAAAACSSGPDLKTALKLVPGLTGYYDDGPMADGQNRLVPSITFQLQNTSDQPITHVDLAIAFWRVNEDFEQDSKEIRALGGTALEPGATGEAFTVRSSVGYYSVQARAEFFTNSHFVDFKVRFFAKKRGRTFPLGEVMVERRLIPNAGKAGSRP
jgi:hypothetical protein